MKGISDVDINSIDNGQFAVIQTKCQFIIKIGEELIGPFPKDKKTVRRIYNMMNSLKNTK